MTDVVRLLVAARAAAVSRSQQLPATPAELAKRIIPGYRLTPTLALISDALADAVENPDRRYIISTPPRSGKSVLVSQIGVVWALSRNPNGHVILKSYADELAEEHSREARRLIAENHELLGIELSTDKASVGRWQVAGGRGGMLAGGILTGVTGFGCDLLVVDDPVKNAVEADSAAQRRRLLTEFRSSLLTRLHPGASCVVVMTRWHPSDLAGELLAEGGWTHINVPAVAEAGIPDALSRIPGAAMTSALGFDAEHYATSRRISGERTWYALYQGVPSSPQGALIKQDWLERRRMAAAPRDRVRTVVGVDPSDSGERDSAGVVAASLTADGVVAVIADVSAPMTSDEWARAAVDLAIDVGASEIAVEAFSTGTTYVRVVREALARYKPNHAIRVTGWPPKGRSRRGDAVARSAPLLQALETGTCRIAGHLPELESAAVQWQAGQHQPDALAALVIAHDRLAPVAGQQMVLVSPLAHRDTSPPEWMTRRIGPGPNRSLIPAMREPDSTAVAKGRHLSRSLQGNGYDPLAYQRPTRRVR